MRLYTSANLHGEVPGPVRSSKLLPSASSGIRKNVTIVGERVTRRRTYLKNMEALVEGMGGLLRGEEAEEDTQKVKEGTDGRTKHGDTGEQMEE
jgi:hypothetical protein